ncbi:isatin hydrolase-like [Oculina patagonica]
MTTLVIKLAFSALFWFPVLGGPLKQEWIELSYPFDNETIYWPTSLNFKHTKVFDGYTDDGFYYSKYDLSGAEHGGTHLDAPSHFAEGKWTAHEIPLDRLIGPAIKIDISSKAAQSPDAQLMTSDLEAWEKKHGRIPDDVILLVFTNWGRHWPDKKKYLGTDTDDLSLLHFPGIHPDASRWLVKNRQIKMVGIDTASIDYGQSKMFETHQILCKENIPGLENLAYMAQLPVKGFTVYAAPMSIRGGSGGPCRVFALLDCA